MPAHMHKDALVLGFAAVADRRVCLGKSQQLPLHAVWGKMNPCIQRCPWVSFIYGVKKAPRMPSAKAEDRLKDGH